MLQQQTTKLNIAQQQINRWFSIGDVVVLFFVFLASMNFINRFAYCIFIGFAMLFLFGAKTFRINIGIIPLLLFSISLAIFWEGAQTSITALIRAFVYPLCFALGSNLPLKHTSLAEREKTLRSVALVIAFGTWFHLVLNMIKNLGVGGSISNRNTDDFWSGDRLSATGQAALACLMIGFAIAILFSNTKLWKKICAIFALITILYYNLTLAGRTILVIVAIVAVIAFLYYISHHKISKKTFKLMLAVCVFIAAIAVAYSYNAFGIKDVIEDSIFYQRFFGQYRMDIYEETRSDAKLFYLENMLDYPFGGANIRDISGSYAHDLYLDTYDEAGVFAFLAIVVVVIDATVKAFRVIRNKRVSFETKQIILCVMTALHLEFWVEPILAGMVWLLACFCILYGAIYRIESEIKNEEVRCIK